MERKITVLEGKKDVRKHFSLNSPISFMETGDKKLRVAVYCRVSTEQETQQRSFDNQVSYYKTAIAKNPSLELVDIYGDEGKSGLGEKWRDEFNRLLDDCKAGKIDMVITKSISRFARNTQDCLKYARLLKSMNVAVYFEKESINTLDAKGEVLFTILSVLAQEESRNLSDNVSWAYEKQFKEGRVVVNAKRFYGYDKDSEGYLIINEEQAEIVRRMYKEYLDGYSEHYIATQLNKEQIPGVFGKPRWLGVTVGTILSNEKNKGDLLLQKTVTDFFSKRSVKNEGFKPQYYVEDDHEPIVSRDIWEATKLEMDRRRAFRDKYNIKNVQMGDEHAAFQGKVICSKCQDIYTKYGVGKMHCRRECGCQTIKIEELEKIVVEACRIIQDNEKAFRAKWEKQILEGNPLQVLRAKQMMQSVPKLAKGYDDALALRVLGHINKEPDGCYTITFLDNTEVRL